MFGKTIDLVKNLEMTQIPGVGVLFCFRHYDAVRTKSICDSPLKREITIILANTLKNTYVGIFFLVFLIFVQFILNLAHSSFCP